jgi:uncharacterized membrane protein YeiB
MNDWLTLLSIGSIHALEVVVLPAFVLLALGSLAWRARTGAWIALWKLGVALLVIALVATATFAWLWRQETAASDGPGARRGPHVRLASA